MKQRINNLSPEIFREGINATIDNAEDLYKAANVLCVNGHYAIANSLFILSLEESIKVFALYNQFRIDDDRNVEQLFTSHKEKINILKEGYFSLSSETEAMIIAFEKALKEVPNKDEAQIEKLASKYYAKFYPQILKFNQKNKPKEDNWWNSSNQLKQNGLYVGFENGKWIDPKKITKNEAATTAIKAMKILTHVLQYKNADLKKHKSFNKDQLPGPNT